MTPISMMKNADIRLGGRNDRFREYMRTEYGSPDAAWIVADAVRPKVSSKSGRSGGRVWRWFARRFRIMSARGLEV
jgi:hypothetical protein